jgi:hypothetical protein
MKTHSPRRFSFDNPATYQICVEGQVDLEWSDRLEGMAISLELPKDKPPISTLSGELPDQAALIGLLTTLYEWHLSLLSVRRI